MAWRWLLAVALGAGPAAAVGDVTGVYRGTIACEQTDGSGDTRIATDATLFVDDAGSETAYAYLNNSGYFFRLAVVSAPGSDQGRIGGPGCTLSAASGGPLLQLEVKAKPGSDKASLKGELIVFEVGANPHHVQVCRLTLKREELAQPIPDCP